MARQGGRILPGGRVGPPHGGKAHVLGWRSRLKWLDQFQVGRLITDPWVALWVMPGNVRDHDRGLVTICAAIAAGDKTGIPSSLTKPSETGAKSDARIIALSSGVAAFSFVSER